ncbi:hypothetical protein K440DRAFT_663197 [Wilcoxina mikolae CBS 423.85]|nr:hypothetical protein K440DRAFT_663197 [Wilcoxina mikolae CBS 423.85]
MDPTSLAASIAGLLRITALIATIVTKLTLRVKDAPATSRIILDNTSSTRTIIVQLKELLESDHEAWETSRIALDEMKRTLVGCELQIDELRKHLDGLVGTTDGQKRMRPVDRLRWASKENVLRQTLQDLRVYKTNLIDMIILLNYKTNIEASSRSGRPRWSSNPQGFSATSQPSDCMTVAIGNTAQFSINSNVPYDLDQASSFRFLFEEELNQSQVYRKAMARRSVESFIALDSSDSGGSGRADISISDVSNITVQFTPYDVYKNQPGAPNEKLEKWAFLEVIKYATVLGLSPTIKIRRNLNFGNSKSAMLISRVVLVITAVTSLSGYVIYQYIPEPAAIRDIATSLSGVLGLITYSISMFSLTITVKKGPREEKSRNATRDYTVTASIPRPAIDEDMSAVCTGAHHTEDFSFQGMC